MLLEVLADVGEAPTPVPQLRHEHGEVLPALRDLFLDLTWRGQTS